MNEWGMPISKDKIIARRNKLIEYQKIGEVRFTPLYEAIDENILDINYMLHEISNLQSKIDKINQYLEEYFIFDDKNGEYYQTHTFDKDNAKELHDILKEDK